MRRTGTGVATGSLWKFAEANQKIGEPKIRLFAAKWGSGLGLVAEDAVEVEGGADEGEVGEGLREVAEGLALGAGLLGVEAEVIGVAEHALEDDAGLLEFIREGLAGPGEGLDEPE